MSSAPAKSSKKASASAVRSGTVLPSTPGPSKKMPPGGDPQAHRPRRGDRLARVPEHVHHRGHAAEELLGEAERRPEPHRVAIEDRAFGLPHLPEPWLQRQVLDQAAEQAVGGMAVGVDQPRHQDHAAGVDHLARLGADLGRGADARDPPGADRHRAVADDRALRVRRDHQRMGDDQIVGQGGSPSRLAKGSHARRRPVNRPEPEERARRMAR